MNDLESKILKNHCGRQYQDWDIDMTFNICLEHWCIFCFRLVRL